MKRRRNTTPPWRRHPKPPNNVYRLRLWRESATRRAKLKGARRACGLCKRAMMGVASVTTTLPWDNRVKRKRWLCVNCWRRVVEWLTTLEYELDEYDLPIDPTAYGITLPGAKGERIRPNVGARAEGD